jgi:hypothetical protein
MIRATLLLLPALLAPIARADDPGDSAGVVPSDPVFEATLTDGARLRGRLAQLRLGEAASLTLVGDDDPGRSVPLDRVVKLERPDARPAYPPAGSLIVLPEGDRLRAILDDSDGTTLRARPRSLGDAVVPVPLGRVLGLILAPPPEPAAMESLIRRVRDEPRDDEALWMANGDRLAGSFLGLDARQVAFDGGGGAGRLDRAAVVALGLDPALVDYPRPEGAYLELALNDGSRLGVVECRVERGELVARSRLGPELRLPLRELAGAHVLGGPVEYLADREPASDQYVAYLGEHPGTFGRDATWDGHHLRLAGRPFDRGLGMLPRTLLLYPVRPGDRRFQATVGLDDRAGDQASVAFRVLAGKTEVFASPLMTRRDAPLPVDVELGDARVLILVVEFGERGDVQDSADWVEARVIRDPAAGRPR